MAEEPVVGVRRRGRQEVARLAALYRKSGMGRSEFCRSHGMALSTLARHLKKPSSEMMSDAVHQLREITPKHAVSKVLASSGENCLVTPYASRMELGSRTRRAPSSVQPA